MAELTKDAILAMEQVYLPRIMALEVAVLTCVSLLESDVDLITDEEVKTLTKSHLKLVVDVLNNKEYLDRVFDEETKRKLSHIKVDKENK